jgi:beta-ribofuranosylaminobenzene 5'-phosphate synthase
MHADGPRRNGGIGFAINSPSAVVTFEQSDSFSLVDHRPMPITSNETEAIRNRIELARRQRDLPSSIAVSVSGDLLTHHGMGSGTALRLACIEGLLLTNGLECTESEAIRLSGRGGTSGIGISSYFFGGFVFDLGVPHRPSEGFVPSSGALNPDRPLLLKRVDLPDWPLGICIPAGCRAKSQAEELLFFKETAPLDERHSFEAAYVSLFGVLAAAADQDFDGFCSGIDRMQLTRWKTLERLEYGHSLIAAERRLRDLGASCVGMSSLGPLLYFFGPPDAQEAISEDFGTSVTLTRPRNEGRQVVREC